ncbi:hypothetical protein ABT104_00600 [Streptomyces mobaraensis]
MTAICIGGLTVLTSDLFQKVRHEERRWLRRSLEERAREHRDQ